MNLKDFPMEYKNTAFANVTTIMLAAKNIQESEEISKSIFTEDEQLKIGRRLEIFELLAKGSTVEDIIEVLNTSEKTIHEVRKSYHRNSKGFNLLLKAKKEHSQQYYDNKYKKVTSLKGYTKTIKTSFSFKQVKR